MAELIRKEDTLNQGREKLNEAIKDAETAKNISAQADDKATQALTQSESTQTQLDTIVINGDSSVEAAQARVSTTGTAYGTLKQRLDSEYQEVTTQLAQTVSEIGNVSDFREWQDSVIEKMKSEFNERGFNVRWNSLLALDGDWTEAIQTAVNTHKHVLLPSSSELIVSDVITLPSDCVFDGNFAKLKIPDHATSSSAMPKVIELKGISNVKVFNLIFDGNNLNQDIDHIGISIQNCEHIKISNCHFKNLKRQAIQVVGEIPQDSTSKGVYNLTVSFCDFIDVWTALQVTQSDSRFIDFSHNYVEECFEHGMTTYPGCSHVTVSNNIILDTGLNEEGEMYSAGSGIRLFETKYATISDNIIINPRFGGIRVALSEPAMTYQRSSHITITGNIVKGGARKGSIGHGIDIVGDYCIASNNIVEDFTAYNFARGISIRGDHCITSTNIINRVKTSAVYIAGNNNSVLGNDIIDADGHAIMVGVLESDGTIVDGNRVAEDSVETTSGLRVDTLATNTHIGINIFDILAPIKIRNLGVGTKIVEMVELANN